MLSLDRLESTLRTLPRLTIGLVGDLFLDRYLELVPGASELSIETGLEAYQVERVRNAPGALGTVMNNLAALGAGLLVPVTVIGDDGHGYDLLKEVRKLPVDTGHILALGERLTPTYTKPMRGEGSGFGVQGSGGGSRELNRLDVRTRVPLSAAATAEVCRRVEQVFRTSDGLIVLDQLVDEDCGVVNGAVRETLAALARENPGRLIYADSRRFLGKFAAATLKGNRSEVLSAVGNALRGVPAVESAPDHDIQLALAQLSRKTSRPAFCTVGEQGILVARPDSEPVLVPGYPVSGPVDIVGAGDAATSGIVSGLLSGASELEAAAFGNLVASITVQQLGATGTATPQQVRERWREVQPPRLTVVQVEKMIVAGALTEQDRCELIRGSLILKGDISDPHMAAVKYLSNWFVLKGAGSQIISTQNAIKLADSRPEPDLTVLKFRPDYYRGGTPTPPDILLLIEVADTSLEFDRTVKLPLYAENGIAEFWLVNLPEACLEVYRQPRTDGSYATQQVVRGGESISPLLLQDHVLAVDDLLGR
jgi:bifunctional ADP-heptose synthase (sugar kinase/adenylyltransferase)/Uma2 family endonuclease